MDGKNDAGLPNSKDQWTVTGCSLGDFPQVSWQIDVVAGSALSWPIKSLQIRP